MVNVELWEQKKSELKLTFDELSNRSGVPKRTILGIFRKEVLTPRIDTVQAIERALGISDGWTAADRAAGVVERLSVPITADEDEILTLLREVEEKKGAAAREVAQRVTLSVLEEMLK